MSQGRVGMNRQKNRRVASKVSSETGELRQDLLTGKWVVVSTGRAKRPSDFASDIAVPRKLVKVDNDCPFCRLDKFVQEPDVLRLPDDPDSWEVHIFGNKYPAFRPTDDFRSWKAGPYRAMEAVGYHELMATRWHNEIDAKLTRRQLALQLEALVLRYRELKEKPSVNYIQIIKNHGEQAGASLEHPHHQIFTLPVLPNDVQDMLSGAAAYARDNGQDPFSVLLDFEQSEDVRIVARNEQFTALCPFASRVSFEVWIIPNQHQSFFEDTGPEQREAMADVMHEVFARLYTGLNNPPYNYYIHSAPCDETGFVCDRSTFGSFRWHMVILPRLSVWGGLEMGTGLEITTALPEESAAYLRDQNIAS